ncbi:site-specific tyrosine recombinase/integron integrase [Clostridium sporogenes]|uniref:site-specific tyrosine recombinase/integron integrase n=2 Tax=Clostridium sporogenes TaxID=1509 RepID=UPI001FAC075F|nr:site-specific tyrosine recombinase/integron integrase [Clostridium sporogenes]
MKTVHTYKVKEGGKLTMFEEEIAIKIIGKVTLMDPNINQLELRDILLNVLNGYEITSKETSLVKTDLPEKAMMYIAVKKLDGISEKTLYNYKLHLEKFNSYIPKPVNFITTTDIRIYLSQISKNKKQSTMATEISILKSFFSWLYDEEIINKNPMRKIKQPKVSKRLRSSLTIEEIELLRDACKTVRQRALLETLYSTACRLDEVVKLNINDINFNTMSAKVIGKGDKERVVYLSSKSKIYLEKYFEERIDNNKAVFVAGKKPFNRLGRRSIEREIGEIGILAKLEKSIYPHILRHSFATHALQSGMTLDTIQKILGHSDPATTQIYSELNDSTVHEQYKKLNF